MYKLLSGRNRQEQENFKRFRSYYLFESNHCNPAQGHEKGGVENDVSYAQRNFMTPLVKANSKEVVASHPRCFGREQNILDPLHYLNLLEQRPGAFEHAKPLRHWRKHWPKDYDHLLEALRTRSPDGRGVKEFIAVLKLHRQYPAEQVQQAVQAALELGAASLDGVTLCLRQIQHAQPQMHALEAERFANLAAFGNQPLNLQQYDRLVAR